LNSAFLCDLRVSSEQRERAVEKNLTNSLAAMGQSTAFLSDSIKIEVRDRTTCQKRKSRIPVHGNAAFFIFDSEMVA